MTPTENTTEFEFHFLRLWADRNDDTVTVFANGHRFDRAARRANLRMVIAAIRRSRARGW